MKYAINMRYSKEIFLDNLRSLSSTTESENAAENAICNDELNSPCIYSFVDNDCSIHIFRTLSIAIDILDNTKFGCQNVLLTCPWLIMKLKILSTIVVICWRSFYLTWNFSMPIPKDILNKFTKNGNSLKTWTIRKECLLCG